MVKGVVSSDELDALIANLEIVRDAWDHPDPARHKNVGEHLRAAWQSAERIRHAADAIALPAQLQSTTEPTGQFRILVVDDEVAVGTSLARALRNYDVVVLDNAKEALARLEAGERFNLILCDLLMPEMTGMDLYEETVRLAPEQTQNFVFMTGGAVTPRARDFVATVPNAVVTKPFDVNAIRDLVRQKEGPHRSERVAMVVDDDAAIRALIVRWLSAAKFRCTEYESSTAALSRLMADPSVVDVVVHDVMMPELDGFEVVAKLKAGPATAHIPIILLTAQAIGEADIARGVNAGATFYVTKPFSGPVLVSKVRVACERSEAEREVRTRLHLAEERATRDALTGIMNRRGFDGRFAEATANATRHREPVALVMLDLDHFKRVNDTFGHAGGDRVLLYFARALRHAIRVGDQAFRYGGEEFALLLPRCDADGALRVVMRVQHDLRERPISLVEGKAEIVRFSAGIATAEEKNAFRVEDLVGRADAALYAAKNTGRDRVEVHGGS